MRFSSAAALAALGGIASLSQAALTEVHEAGRCAIRGNCGKQSFFGGELPCPDNGLAHQPDQRVRQQLVHLCGKKWEDGPVCCKEEQVDFLSLHLSISHCLYCAVC